MVNNIIYIITIATAILIIPFLFLDIKNIPKPIKIYLQLHLITLIICLGIWMSGFSVSLFGNDYSYNTVPSPIKEKIELFISEAQKRNIDVSKIESTKFIYLPWKVDTTMFSGACNIKTNTLYIPKESISTQVIFHELGHCVLGYEHFLEESQINEIMYYSTSDHQVLDKETIDRFFFNTPNPSTIAKTTEISLKFLLNPFSLIFGIFLLLVLYGFLHNIFKLIKNILKKLN